MNRFLRLSSAPIRSARAPPTLTWIPMRPTRKKSQTAFSDLRNVGWINGLMDWWINGLVDW